MNLKYAVLTMVDRDDLEDGGAAHVAKVFAEIRKTSPECRLEFLGGDFQANDDFQGHTRSQARGLYP